MSTRNPLSGSLPRRHFLRGLGAAAALPLLDATFGYGKEDQLPTAWNAGYPAQGLKNADALISSFKSRAKNLFFKCWDPRDGISPSDAQTWQERTAWFQAKHLPYLDLQAGLDRVAMKRLGWFADNIHLAPPGGQGIGEAIAKLLLP